MSNIRSKGRLTPSIHWGTQEISQITYDAMDHFVGTVVSGKSQSSERKDLYTQLSEISHESKVGGKTLLIIPKEDKLLVETKESPFQPLAETDTRFRQCSREELLKGTEEILKKYPNETKLLDSISTISHKEGELTYSIIHQFIVENAEFISTKMEEEKTEDTAGKKARFNHAKIKPLFLVSNNERMKTVLNGVIRSLDLGEGIAYLSDETVKQNIISDSSFSGKDPTDKQKSRWQFLLAYLFHQAAKSFQQENFVIIAAKDRVEMYEAMGFKKFDSTFAKHYSAYVRFAKPGPLLLDTKKHLIKIAQLKNTLSPPLRASLTSQPIAIVRCSSVVFFHKEPKKKPNEFSVTPVFSGKKFS